MSSETFISCPNGSEEVGPAVPFPGGIFMSWACGCESDCGESDCDESDCDAGGAGKVESPLYRRRNWLFGGVKWFICTWELALEAKSFATNYMLLAPCLWSLFK